MRPAVLYVAHRFPFPPDKGDRIRTFNLLKFVAQHAAIHLACFADEPVDEKAQAGLRRYCERLEVVPLGGMSRWVRALGSLAVGRTVTQGAFSSPAMRAVVRRWAGETDFELCIASASSMVPYLRLKEVEQVPAFIDLVDVDSQKWFDYAAASRVPKTWLFRLEGRRLRQLERELPPRFRAATVVSEAEADIYRQFGDPQFIHAVPNGVDLDYFQPMPEEEQQACVFVGALDYAPNVQGACWFCRDVWPLIHQRRPQTKLWLVGRRPAKAVQQLAQVPGVEVVGQVPDVRPYVARAAVAVVPLQIARGVQNKVLEAMAMGRPVVASPQALQGVRATPGVHLRSASTVSEWVEAVESFLDDADLRRRYGTAGREYIEEHHRWERCLEPLGSLLGTGEPAR